MQTGSSEAIVAGEARADLDPAALIESMAGTTLFGLLFRPGDLDDAWIDQVTTLC